MRGIRNARRLEHEMDWCSLDKNTKMNVSLDTYKTLVFHEKECLQTILGSKCEI